MEIDSTTRCVVALDEVVQTLEQGRVRRLLSGKPSDKMILECVGCGHLQATEGSCQYCKHSLMVADCAQEVLIRKAVLTDAEIAVPPLEALNARRGVAALLRF